MNLFCQARVSDDEQIIMRPMTSISKYEDYTLLHNNFSEDYQAINYYVLGLYAFPKKFIDQTGPALDRFIREYSMPGTPRGHDLSTRSIVEFIKQVDVFTIDTIALFDDHKNHVSRCSEYMRKVAHLDKKYAPLSCSECPDDYVQLAPAIIEMHKQLDRLREKADEMISRLTKLELRWVRIRARVEA